MEPIIGIDLGTTNSEVAFIIDETAEVLKDNDNGIYPSCVGIDDDGKILVGAEARNQAVIAPESTVLSVKRLMGSDTRIVMKDSSYLPQEISAFILKALKERAEKTLGKKIGKAVITVPAYFTDAQRQATREAGQIAGLEVVRIINEPTAAAIAYESAHSETRRILVFDLGGGTFDVSVVKIENQVVEVLASTGDNRLGGDDFDLKIADRLAIYCKEEYGIEVTGNAVVMARLKRAAESAKIQLSSAPYATIEEDHIGKKRLRDIHLSYELSREEFESMIDDDLSRTMESVNKALGDAGLLASSIDKIILVGGSTRIPAISRMLEEKFGLPPRGEIDPDLCVALGAAMMAGREMGLESTGVLLDITPYTFGTSCLDMVDGLPNPNVFVPLIRRNIKLPAAKTEAFFTLYDNQEGVEIKVYQGEKRDALDNILIGNYMFKLTKAPEGSPILLNYDLDLNGILKIKAVEKETGREINAVIENAFSGISGEEIEKYKDKIDSMWGESPEPAADEVETEEIKTGENPNEGELPSDIAEILNRAKSKLDDAPEEDRADMIELISDIKNAVRDGNLDEARRYGDELEDVLFYIG